MVNFLLAVTAGYLIGNDPARKRVEHTIKTLFSKPAPTVKKEEKVDVKSNEIGSPVSVQPAPQVIVPPAIRPTIIEG